LAWDTITQFNDAIPFERYVSAHAWYRWSGPLEIVSAWRLYKRAKTPTLGFILLGDTKIRKDPTLVYAFGLLSAGGIQDKEEIAMLAALKLQAKRRHHDRPNVGEGSILSDQNWSPLLNDSLVLGGVHAYRDFHFTDDRLQTYNFAKPAGVAGVRQTQELISKAANARLADLSKSPWEVQVWRDFFHAHPTVFWDSTAKIPRVLARELIGLMTFGYEPVLSPHQLTFQPRSGASVSASFGPYLQALRQSGYFAHDEKALRARISQYLFGHPEAF
jgi:hypothetical protein